MEGAVNYTALLFIPAHAGSEYYTKDYKKGLQLYCNGVLITDCCEDLVPDCYAFVKGVVDSSDLSLNISREVLQQDRQLKAIAGGIEKKITIRRDGDFRRMPTTDLLSDLDLNPSWLCLPDPRDCYRKYAVRAVCCYGSSIGILRQRE